MKNPNLKFRGNRFLKSLHEMDFHLDFGPFDPNVSPFASGGMHFG